MTFARLMNTLYIGDTKVKGTCGSCVVARGSQQLRLEHCQFRASGRLASAMTVDCPEVVISGTWRLRILPRAVSYSGTRGRVNNQKKLSPYTMTTTNALIEPVIRIPRLSTWMKLKSWTLNLIEESPLIQALCCLDASELQCYRTDNLVRASMRDEMRLHMGYTGKESCVVSAIDDVLIDTGYDLSDGGSIREANKGVKRTMNEWDTYFKQLGINVSTFSAASNREASKRPARIVPKFAAACALHMRAKLGALATNEANMLLVQRKYLELCRRHRVRDVDTVLHQQFVMNAVFTEGVLDEVATTRRRLPAWIGWLDSLDKASALAPTVC